MDAGEVVRNPRLWRELAKTLRQQAEYVTAIADAIEENNFERLKHALLALTGLVKTRQPLLQKLAPAIQELISEIFSKEEM